MHQHISRLNSDPHTALLNEQTACLEALWLCQDAGLQHCMIHSWMIASGQWWNHHDFPKGLT